MGLLKNMFGKRKLIIDLAGTSPKAAPSALRDEDANSKIGSVDIIWTANRVAVSTFTSMGVASGLSLREAVSAVMGKDGSCDDLIVSADSISLSPVRKVWCETTPIYRDKKSDAIYVLFEKLDDDTCKNKELEYLGAIDAESYAASLCLAHGIGPKKTTAENDNTVGEGGTVRPIIKELRETNNVEGLIKALKFKEPGIRTDAAWALGHMGDPRAVGPLIEALTDVNKEVRYATAYALAELGDKSAVEPLIHIMLHDLSRDIRYVAADALGIIGDDRAIEPLFNALRDDINVVRQAIMSLIKIGNEMAVNYLCRVLLEDFNSELQLGVAERLIEHGDEKAVEALIQYLIDKDEDTHQAILDIFAMVKCRENWKGKKKKQFDTVYSVVMNRLNLPADKEPVEIIYEGQNVDEVIEWVCKAISGTPVLNESQVMSGYELARKSWGTKLFKGTFEDLAGALRPRLQNDFADSQFSGFGVLTYYTQRSSQVESHFEGTFKGYRIWITEKEIFFCFYPE